MNVLGDMPWGAHVCMFYQSKDDLFDTVGPYFKAGLESNEFCLWFPTAPPTIDEARLGLSLRVPDLQRYLAVGDMEILPGEAWYLDCDRFDVERLARAWDDKLRGALAKGYDGMRASGNRSRFTPNIGTTFVTTSASSTALWRASRWWHCAHTRQR